MWEALRQPRWVSRVVWLIGAITLSSALLPSMRGRVDLVHDVVPDVFPAAATTGAAAIGALLILLARSVRRGKFRGWLVATVLSGIAVLAHLVKGLDVEEAAMSLLVFGYLLATRREFTARPDPRSNQRLVGVLLFGPLLAGLLGFLWLVIDADGQAPGTGLWDRVAQSLLGLVGIAGPVKFVSASSSDQAAVALVVLGAAVLFVALLVATQPVDGPHPPDDQERDQLACLLDRWGSQDSLGYFTLRDDRCVIFAPSGKSALTYRVVGTVSLAAGDPIGDVEAWPGVINAWLAEAKSYGWTPAVLAASEVGAQAFDRAGLDALELGDEAILDVDSFSLEGRAMRGIRQAVTRCARAGITVTCHRVADLTPADLVDVRHRADAWRDGEVERGFSMALGRFGEARDPETVVVLARDEAGDLRGLLHFVPWGRDGLSLDLMRRDRLSENGLIEAMVAGLLTAAPGLGVHRVSLNFAVFRSVFARGERLGAGPVLRLWRSILLGLSRFWQIESLYRANAKYHPTWEPRFVCFRSSSDLPRVGIAALRAEAFLVAPSWWRNRLA
jgi:lysyl-tRNA synthetase, class II